MARCSRERVAWRVPFSSKATTPEAPRPVFEIPEFELDTEPSPTDRAALLARVQEIAQAGKAAVAGAAEAETPADAWEKVEQLRGLVNEARQEHEALAGVAVTVNEKRRTIATVLAQQADEERILRRRSRGKRGG